jgi:hypothetical protein
MVQAPYVRLLRLTLDFYAAWVNITLQACVARAGGAGPPVNTRITRSEVT